MSYMNARQLYLKIPKKRNKIEGTSITFSYMWHINTSEYVSNQYTHFGMLTCQM